MITAENLVRHELIGLRARVTDSTNSDVIGVEGVILDETKSTFRLRTGDRSITVPKAHSTWEFFIGETAVSMHGDMIQKRPHERLVI